MVLAHDSTSSFYVAPQFIEIWLHSSFRSPLFILHVGQLSPKRLRCRIRYRFAAASGFGAQQRLFNVLRRRGQDVVCQYCVGAVATREANITEIFPTVSFESPDLRFIVGAMTLCQSSQSWQPSAMTGEGLPTPTYPRRTASCNNSGPPSTIRPCPAAYLRLGSSSNFLALASAVGGCQVAIAGSGKNHGPNPLTCTFPPTVTSASPAYSVPSRSSK